MIWDHNKERVYDRTKRIFTSKAVEDRVWGVAHHWYTGDHFEGLRLVHECYNKTLVSAEICGSINEDAHYLAERYGKELFGDFYDGGRKPAEDGLRRFAEANPSLLRPEPLPVYLNPAVRD
jgi:glucosylceramidase